MGRTDANTLKPLPEAGGLNLVAVFDLATLPADILITLEQHNSIRFRQLILFGHAGRQMWQALQASPFANDPDPVDSYSADLVRRCFADTCPGMRFELLYPGSSQAIPLQRLGALAGWHHDSPFHVGVHAERGPWFAYRAVALADSAFAPTPLISGPSPCAGCMDRPCLAACPAASTEDHRVSPGACLDYRLSRDSRCRESCPARQACPLGAGYRYSAAQISYHYRRSLQTILAWGGEKD